MRMIFGRGLLGVLTPRELHLTVFLYTRLQFCLRGVQEPNDFIKQFQWYPEKLIFMKEFIMSMQKGHQKTTSIGLKISNHMPKK